LFGQGCAWSGAVSMGRLEQLSNAGLAGVQDLLQPQELQELQAAALEAAANPIIMSRRDGTIIWVNGAFERLSGYSRAEAIGQNTRLLKSGQQPPFILRRDVEDNSLGAEMAGRIGESTQGWQPLP